MGPIETLQSSNPAGLAWLATRKDQKASILGGPGRPSWPEGKERGGEEGKGSEQHGMDDCGMERFDWRIAKVI